MFSLSNTALQFIESFCNGSGINLNLSENKVKKIITSSQQRNTCKMMKASSIIVRLNLSDIVVSIKIDMKRFILL